MEQRSPEWFQAKLGKLGASEIDGILDGRYKRGERAGKRTDTAIKFMTEIAGERVTGKRSAFFQTNAMKDGIEREPDAIAEYSFVTDSVVEKAGFILHPLLNYSGASPDGLIGDDGGIEVKCPTLSTFLAWKIAGKVPEKHLAQIHWGMACTGRKWWDFVAYHPDMPHHLRLMIIRVNRDDSLLESYVKEIMDFELELQEMVQKIMGQ